MACSIKCCDSGLIISSASFIYHKNECTKIEGICRGSA
jgi:hypothetical protein